MRYAYELHEALKRYDELSYRTHLAGKSLAYAWAAKRDEHKREVLDPLLTDSRLKEALVFLKLSGKLPDTSEYARLGLVL